MKKVGFHKIQILETLFAENEIYGTLSLRENGKLERKNCFRHEKGDLFFTNKFIRCCKKRVPVSGVFLLQFPREEGRGPPGVPPSVPQKEEWRNHRQYAAQ